jgi:hypothetical protein
MRKLIVIFLVTTLLPLKILADKVGQAQIITQNERPAQCISKVVITEIDGRLSNVSRQGFKLDAGTHSMNGRAIVNTSQCPAIRGRPSYTIPDLEADFEAGKTYYVGLDHSSKNVEEWRLVIWKVE